MLILFFLFDASSEAHVSTGLPAQLLKRSITLSTGLTKLIFLIFILYPMNSIISF